MVLCLSTFYFGYNLTSLSTFTDSDLDTVTIIYNSGLGTHSYPYDYIRLADRVCASWSFLRCWTCPSHHEFFLPKVSYYLDRQFVLFINLLALIVVGVIQINNIYVLLVCRFFQGVFVGNYMAITPIYIDELAPKQVVGSFGVFTQLFVVVGICTSYSLGLILTSIGADPFVYYRVMVTTNAITIIAQSILLLVNYIP